MAFFGTKKETKIEEKVQPKIEEKVVKPVNNDIIKTPTINVSVIKEKFKVKAELEGEGSLIIGGKFEGNINVTDTVFIEKGAKVVGTINAKNVKIAGDFEGSIYSTATEVTQSGRLYGNITANKTFLGGYVSGIIRSADSVEIFSNGVIETKECKSQNIKINGKVEGKVIASELLEVTSGGSIKGDIITKGIRTEQGGSIIGNIQTYDESIHAVSKPDTDNEIDPDIAKIIDLKPQDLQKYAKKDTSVKRLDKEENS